MKVVTDPYVALELEYLVKLCTKVLHFAIASPEESYFILSTILGMRGVPSGFPQDMYFKETNKRI